MTPRPSPPFNAEADGMADWRPAARLRSWWARRRVIHAAYVAMRGRG